MQKAALPLCYYVTINSGGAIPYKSLAKGGFTGRCHRPVTSLHQEYLLTDSFEHSSSSSITYFTGCLHHFVFVASFHQRIAVFEIREV